MHRYLDFITIGAWATFFVYWMISATKAKSNISQRMVPFVWYRVGVLVVAIFIIRFTDQRNSNTFIHTFSHNTAVGLIGAVLLLIGLGTAIWARFSLGRNWGFPMTRKNKPELVTTGPYKYVRHPIYTGMILMMLGTTLTQNLYWLIALLAMGSYFIFSAFQEEKNMLQEFPKDYASYINHTKMLIPFIL